jgi:DNA repair photolyase
MNKSKGNMYEFITHTHNPLAGKCFHDCDYCSTKNFYYPSLKNKYSGTIRLDEKAMLENLGKNNFIFAVAQNDLFASNVPINMILDILDMYNSFDNSYLFQTKNPRVLYEFYQIYGGHFPKKSVICSTIESDRYYKNIMNNSPSPNNRALYLAELSKYFPIYLTTEPIMDFNLRIFSEMLISCNAKQINIGANSSNKVKVPEPTKEKVLALIYELEKFTKVHIKSNLNRLIK